MSSFNIIHVINIIIATLSLIPFVMLFLIWFRTRIYDYILISTVFLSASISMYSTALAALTDFLFFYQLHYWMWSITFMILFGYGVGIIWPNRTTPSLFWHFTFGWFSILIFLPFFWSLQEQPESASVLFLEMPHSHSSYFPQGAGLTSSDGSIIYSTGHSILIYLFSIFVIVTNLIASLKSQRVLSNKKNDFTWKIWLGSLSSFLLYYVMGLPWLPRYDFIGLFLVIGLSLLAIIAIRYPEGLIFSLQQASIARSKNIIGNMHNNQFSFQTKQIERIKRYIDSLPDHLKLGDE